VSWLKFLVSVDEVVGVIRPVQLGVDYLIAHDVESLLVTEVLFLSKGYIGKPRFGRPGSSSCFQAAE